MHRNQISAGNKTTYSITEQLAVTPLGEFALLIAPIHIMACDGGRLDVNSVQPAGCRRWRGGHPRIRIRMHEPRWVSLTIHMSVN